MRANSSDLAVVCVLSLLMGVAVVFDVTGFWRAAVGLPGTIILPGYALMAALYPERTLNFWEKVFFSFGLSLALLIPAGFVLNLTSGGLQPRSWLMYVVGFNLIASLVAWVRRRNHAIPVLPGLSGIEIRAFVGLALAFVIGLAALSFARIGAEQQPVVGFTQFWMVPVDPNKVLLGVQNNEKEDGNYRVQVLINDLPIYASELIQIRPGEKWEYALHLPAAAPDAEHVDALLFRFDPDVSTEIYRRAELWRGHLNFF